jgi:hypothetical protein
VSTLSRDSVAIETFVASKRRSMMAQKTRNGNAREISGV